MEENTEQVLQNQSTNDENQPLLGLERIRYPKSVFFIIVNEFCERFNYYGLRTILLIYLIQKLKYDEADATVIFHLSAMAVYMSSILGAIIADSWLGKFKTILILSCVYAIGSLTVAFGAVEQWKLPASEFTIIGLVLIALGSGGIKPCVSAFGGEQFKLPQQENQLKKFFSIFYFVINLGSVLTTFITPIIRAQSCFGMEECFAGGFGLPAVLMVLAIVVFTFGQRYYINISPKGNMFVEVCKCVWSAIVKKYRGNSIQGGSHWLDYAEEDYGISMVEDCKTLFNIIVLYLPLPLFWALFDQQGSRWVSQAMKLDGNFTTFTIQPDQMQVINPLLILVFIPLCEFAIYPFLRLFGIRRPLQKMFIGGILAGIAFLGSMFLEIQINAFEPEKVNILWQLPQIFVMTLAEVMFSVTGLEFAFTQAPDSMKSVIQAFWMLTVAFGDLIVTIVVGTQLMGSQALEFLLFAVLMFIDMLIFMFLSHRFKPATENHL